MSHRLLSVTLAHEQDVVAARQRARLIAQLVGFESQDQTRIATAVSEIARNACCYAGGGWVHFEIEGESAPQLLTARILDQGPGIAELDQLIDGTRMPAGMGMGIIGSKRLVDRCDVKSTPGKGTEVVLSKLLPANAALITGERLAELAAVLAATRPSGSLQEIEQQNRELVRALSELREQQEEMEKLNHELEDTNRGVVALYAELDERADQLRRADEMKTRFLSNMSHEFRTPLNSIRALSGLLLDRIDGPLTDEQVKQVTFIRKATDDLTQIVDDLLDLAKIAAGKTEVRAAEFTIDNLFGMLRGMLRPLLTSDTVVLRFDDASSLPPMFSDESKISQILRNLVSNALKFTERGEVHVSASVEGDGRMVCIRVRDSGIGIAPHDQERIFEEFTQIASPLQSKVKGTGLGLPLCRRLAKLLGGSLHLQSEPGVGSTFILALPIHYSTGVEEGLAAGVTPSPNPARLKVLVIESDLPSLLSYDGFLQDSAYQLIPARTIQQARYALQSIKPAAIVLDVAANGVLGWGWLSEFKSDPATRDIPIIVASDAKDPSKAYALGADVYLDKPVSRVSLIGHLDALTSLRALVIDDDPAARYTLSRFLDLQHHCVLEAEDGVSGLRAAARTRPSLILLDYQLPDINGADVLRQLKASPSTRDIPVAIVTSLEMDEDQRAALQRQGATVFAKSALNAESFAELLHALKPGRGLAEV